MRYDRRGFVYGVAAYVIWGVSPVYWKLLRQVPATQLIGHRLVWSFLFLVGLFGVTGQLSRLRALWRDGRVVAVYGVAALILAGNWLTYVWAVNAGFIVEASLGYFINPLLSVLLGMVVLRERLRPWQWVAVGLAAFGVGYLTATYGRLPWIALALAGTFSVYGLVTKVAPLDALEGLTLETGLLFAPALAFLAWADVQGQGAFWRAGLGPSMLMAGTGAFTAVPLLLFGASARRIPLSVVGILQYLAPTLQFLIGVLVYREPFTISQLVGYGAVWLALLIFWGDGWKASRASGRKLALSGG
ncbi:MAG: EamA family transporter RarD [Ardenticatenia bacterium]|nr:EamA family transporter RarD [Ardenticatenia bacterium]